MEVSGSKLRVLVTAGASGIGRAIADTFLRNGARVHLCDVSKEALTACNRTAPGIGTTYADVADAGQVDALFQQAAAALGGLDVLVNNAGIAGPTAPIEEIDPADWDKTLAVNIGGMFRCSRRAVPLLKAAGGGCIINLASVAGRLGFPLRTPYAASKWAVVGFTQSLAMEVGPSNIRVNAILPGNVEGDRINRVIEAKARSVGISFDEQRSRILSRVSLRRMISPQDIANMALFLASEAGRNISGQSLSVCGNVESMG
jgi:NAD(P)-dependent dehydrogenase (short-subunit alcohol dehydrogenase family)